MVDVITIGERGGKMHVRAEGQREAEEVFESLIEN
jgi:hypothetical protein